MVADASPPAASPQPATSSPVQKAASRPASPAQRAAASPTQRPKTPPAAPAAEPVKVASPAQRPASPKPAVARPASPIVQAAASPAQRAASSPAQQASPAPEAPGEEKAKEPAKKGKAKAKGKGKKAQPKDKAQGEPPKAATAAREDNLTYDLKHLAAYDIAPLPSAAEFLAYTRDSVQLLVNRLFSLEKKRIEEGMVVELPSDELFKLPRQKVLPKEKPKTRFQKFMEERNMRKRKRSRLVFDEASGDWKPRWGYKSAKKDKERAEQAIYEVKKGEDPDANPFDRMRTEKKLLIARQKMREVRNKVEAAGGKMRASIPDLSDGRKRGKEGLKEVLRRAQLSSGSRGKFDHLAANEATNLNKKRQKVGAPVSGEKERDRYLKAAGKVLSGQTVDSDKAAKIGRQQAQGTKLARKAKVKGVKGTPGKGRRSKQGGRQRGHKIKK